MHRGGPSQYTHTKQQQQQQQQKQKKRLSFKDPEVEGPQQSQLYVGCRPKNQPNKLSGVRKGSVSVENLSLEDQALQIVQSVGSAFSELSLQPDPSEYFDSSAEIQDTEAETFINDCFLSDGVSYQRNRPLQSFKISAQDQEYLDDLTPPLQPSNMRCPPIEIQDTDKNPYHNSIPPLELTEEKFSSSSAQHQIQLLRYQLNQQSQQTQLAHHQVQLLTDQMEAESAARRKAQEQNNNLMNQNKELLNHIEKLFHQVEELEKQVQLREMEKRPRTQDSQVTQLRAPPAYAGTRRMSGDSSSDRPSAANRGVLQTSRRTSLTTLKANAPQHKLHHLQQNPAMVNRKTPPTALKPIYTPATQTRMADLKSKDALHIDETSPPVQSGSLSPFSGGWKLKQEQNQSDTEATTTSVMGRNRTGSFSSFSKLKPPENIATKTSQFSSGGASGITNKKYSSSTSDLYNTSAYQSTKPLVMDDASENKSSVSNVSINTTSKLPRFQPYTARRSSLTKDFDQFSAIGKDKFKTTPQTTLYNR